MVFCIFIRYGLVSSILCLSSLLCCRSYWCNQITIVVRRFFAPIIKQTMEKIYLVVFCLPLSSNNNNFLLSSYYFLVWNQLLFFLDSFFHHCIYISVFLILFCRNWTKIETKTDLRWFFGYRVLLNWIDFNVFPYITVCIHTFLMLNFSLNWNTKQKTNLTMRITMTLLFSVLK